MSALRSQGIVSTGDRAASTAPGHLRTINPYPPREIPTGALWAGATRNGVVIPLAIMLTIVGMCFAVVGFTDAHAEMPAFVPVACLLLAFIFWLAGLTRVRRARRLLEGGMPVRAKVTKVSVNLFVHSGRRHRTVITYDWTFAGQSRHARARGFIGRRDRALVAGEEIDLVCDPSTPEDHLVPLFYGFQLGPF